MTFYTWTTGNYTYYDACFNYHQKVAETLWLRKIIRDNLGDDYLFDEEDMYKFKAKDEYEGFKRSYTTTKR